MPPVTAASNERLRTPVSSPSCLNRTQIGKIWGRQRKQGRAVTGMTDDSFNWDGVRINFFAEKRPNSVPSLSGVDFTELSFFTCFFPILAVKLGLCKIWKTLTIMVKPTSKKCINICMKKLGRIGSSCRFYKHSTSNFLVRLIFRGNHNTSHTKK